MADKLEQVAIRMVEQPPLYSNEPMNNPDVAIRVMNEFLSQMDRELLNISLGLINASFSDPTDTIFILIGVKSACKLTIQKSSRSI